MAAQPAVNNVLSKKVGTFGAVSVNFLVGTILVLVITFVFAGGIRSIEGVESPAWYYWVFGGVGGVAIVLASLIRRAGAGRGRCHGRRHRRAADAVGGARPPRRARH